MVLSGIFKVFFKLTMHTKLTTSTKISVISHTTLRFAISSWKYIPSITALHLTMPHVLGEHPFTEWIQHTSDKAVVS